MKQKDVEALLKLLKDRQDGVAKERDKIDDVISELEGLKESCERAFDALQDARDALSELV